MSVNKKAKLRREADHLWYEIITIKEPFCAVCGEYTEQAHHFFYKHTYPHLRYDLNNGVGICKRCHFILHHQDPKLITDKIINKRGRVWYNRLKRKAYQKPKSSFLTVGYYEKVIEKLSALLNS